MQTDTSQATHPMTALRDLVFVIGVLVIIKELLLRYETLWTYAGPISLATSLAVGLILLARQGISVRDLGLRWEDKIWKFVAFSALAVVLSLVVNIAFNIITTNFFDPGAPTGAGEKYAKRFSHLPGNLTAYVWWLSISWVVGGFIEEILFRGVLINRVESFISKPLFGTIAAVAFQSILFGQQHFYYQGWIGLAATGSLALLFGVLYLVFKRRLWPLIIAHGCVNTLGLTVLFLGGGQA